jgi:hypothetical protein
VKEDQEESGGSLVSSANRGLTRNSGLVRRGLVDLLKLSAESNASGVDANQRESLRPAFDDEEYERVKPFLIASMKHFYKSGMSMADAARAFVDWLLDVYGMSIEAIERLEPYIVRFLEDFKAGKINLETGTLDGGGPDNVQSTLLHYDPAVTPGYAPDSRQVESFGELIRESETASYWMPNASPQLPTPNPASRQRVGVVKGQESQILNDMVYLDLLADRLTVLLKQEDDPEQAFENLVERLADEEVISSQEVNHDHNLDRQVKTLLQDGSLQMKLDEMGIPGNLPPTFPANDPKAQAIFEQMSLERWADSLLEQEANPYR